MEYKKGQLLLIGGKPGFYIKSHKLSIEFYPIGHHINRGYFIHTDTTYFSKDAPIKAISTKELCKLLDINCSWGLADIFNEEDLKTIKNLRKKEDIDV